MSSVSARNWGLPGLALLHPLLLMACARGAEAPFAVGGIDYAPDAAVEWKLPKRLLEVSGFATGSDDRLFAHNDESAVVYEIDYAKGRIIKSFALGNPAVPGDFEGITIVDDRFALTTSDGDLYLAEEGDDGEHVKYRIIHTGLGHRCEIEGVAFEPAERLFFFACKTARDPALKGRVTLLAWSLDGRSEVPERSVGIALAELEHLPGKGRIQPSDLTRSPHSGEFVVAAASHRSLITLSPDGKLVNAVQVPQSGSMKQIEAVAFAADGTLMLGSEGRKEGGRMRVYRAAD